MGMQDFGKVAKNGLVVAAFLRVPTSSENGNLLPVFAKVGVVMLAVVCDGVGCPLKESALPAFCDRCDAISV